jgi:hypothetical protein
LHKFERKIQKMSFKNSQSQESLRHFTTLLEGLMQAHQVEPTEAMVQVYSLAMIDLEPDQMQAAVLRAIRELPRMPRPAELRELAGVNVAEDTRAVEAWSDVQRAVAVGPYKWIDFADQRINATIRSMGGWPNFLESFNDSESEKWARHNFLKAYAAVGDRLSPEACRPLIGLGQKTCVGGKMVDPVVRIECDSPERRTAIKYRPITAPITRPAMAESITDHPVMGPAMAGRFPVTFRKVPT